MLGHVRRRERCIRALRYLFVLPLFGCSRPSADQPMQTSAELPSAPSVPPPAAAGASAPAPSKPMSQAAAKGGSTKTVEPVVPTKLDAGVQPAIPAASNEWRMMGYDEKNWYFNPNETELSPQNAKQLTEKWRFTTSGFPIGTPVIAEGKVFAMAVGGTYAIDFESGKQVWMRSDITGSATVAYDDGFIYVQNSLPAQVYKLRASDGSTVWGPVLNCQIDNGCSGESSPVVVDKTVYVGMENNMLEASFEATDAAGARGAVRALNADSGELRWLYYTIPDSGSVSEDGASVWSSISVDKRTGLVYATTGNNYTTVGPNGDAFHAIDLLMGQKRWVHQVRTGDAFTVASSLNGQAKGTDADFGANPILAELDGMQLIAAGDKGGGFWVLDRTQGTLLWNRDDLSPSHDETFGGIFINGAFDGHAFYVVSNDPMHAGAVLHRLDPKQNGASTWSHTFNEVTWGALSLANGLLFVPSNATLNVMNAETGEVLTQLDTGGTMTGAPAVAQGRVVVKSGFLYKDPATKANDQIICYALPSGTAHTPATAAAGSPAEPEAASFSAIYRNVILNQGCNSGQCHSGFAAGKLDMSSQAAAHTSLVGVAAMGMTLPGAAASGCSGSGLTRVIPGDPDHSLLVAKLEHTQACGEPMPNATTTLPATQLQAIREWIRAGAPQN